MQEPTTMNECRTTDQLKEAYKVSQNYRQILTTYETPCLDMFSSVTYNWLSDTDNKLSNISFTYKEKYYEEILYAQDFNPESFLSNVGGFVGMFLGYSLMQLPEMLFGLAGTFESLKRKLSTGKY